MLRTIGSAMAFSRGSNMFATRCARGLSSGAKKKINAPYAPFTGTPRPELAEVPLAVGASDAHWDESWGADAIKGAIDPVMLTWVPSGSAKAMPLFERAEGVYLYDSNGKQYLDWTSSAVCTNFGHTVPQEAIDAAVKQLSTLPYVYSGQGMVEVRVRLAKIMEELTPGDINGFLFPLGGAEANEAAIRMARMYTGRSKILTSYRSYHGGSSATLAATGDFRRKFAEADNYGFVKTIPPHPMVLPPGGTDEQACELALAALEEQILGEGPSTIAAIMLEPIVGAGGVLIPPQGYLPGVRALCDKYNILLIIDEVMTGFGRTGKVWAFEHFPGVLPDIITSAKGVTGAFLPLSVVGVRDHIRSHFQTNPPGWGATYQAHPVTMAFGYEMVKNMVKRDLAGRVKAMQPVLEEEMQNLLDRYSCVKQGRVIGLFGCLDLVKCDGSPIQLLGAPSPPFVDAFKAALLKNGINTLFRPPHFHCAPPLVITEEELRDGFERVSRAFDVLEAAVGR